MARQEMRENDRMPKEEVEEGRDKYKKEEDERRRRTIKEK